jgi:hypothetical protein
MSEITIRIWDGCKVVEVISIYQRGGSSVLGAVGGAQNSSNPQIEIDPWAGLIVDHSVRFASPVPFRERMVLEDDKEDEDA